MSKTQYYECPVCNKVTRHIQLSSGEASAMENDSEVEQALNRLNDYIGISAVFRTVSGRDFWKCSECGKGTLRTSSGKVIRCL